MKNLVAEMRSVLNMQNVSKGFRELPENFPDWAIQNIFERRNGLTLTPLPAEVRGKLKKLSDLNIIGLSETRQGKAARLMAEIAADGDADAADVERLKLRYKNLFS